MTSRLTSNYKTNFDLIAGPSAKSSQANRAISSTGTALTRFLTCMAPVIGKRFSPPDPISFGLFHSQRDLEIFSGNMLPEYCVLFTLSRNNRWSMVCISSFSSVSVICYIRGPSESYSLLWPLVRTFIIYEWCSCRLCACVCVVAKVKELFPIS